MNLPQAPIITPYKSCLIVESHGRVDIVDTARGRWMQASSVRNAKWTITVWERLNREFTQGTGLYDPRTAVGLTGRPLMETLHH